MLREQQLWLLLYACLRLSELCLVMVLFQLNTLVFFEHFIVVALQVVWYLSAEDEGSILVLDYGVWVGVCVDVRLLVVSYSSKAI